MSRFIIYWLLIGICCANECKRRLYEAKGDRTPGNSGFIIEISSATNTSDQNPESYTPGESYIG